MTTTKELPRKLLDVACRVRVSETLHRDDELIDQGAHALKAALEEIALLRTSLRFYARGEHYHLDDAEEWDTVSGEPQNWLMSGQENSISMVENGHIAGMALSGVTVNWISGDDDETPKPLDNEVSCAA